MTALFVYGTLMSGQAQAGLLGSCRRTAATARGTLWDLPAGYPALSDGDGVVHGELVELDNPAVLTLLDRYEGVDEGLYHREQIEVVVGLRRVSAFAYRMANPRLRGGLPVTSGRWKAPRSR